MYNSQLCAFNIVYLQYNGKPFKNTRQDVAQWDEVERAKNEIWKQACIKTRKKNKIADWFVKNVAGEPEDKLGFKLEASDGKHR